MSSIIKQKAWDMQHHYESLYPTLKDDLFAKQIIFGIAALELCENGDISKEELREALIDNFDLNPANEFLSWPHREEIINGSMENPFILAYAACGCTYDFDLAMPVTDPELNSLRLEYLEKVSNVLGIDPDVAVYQYRDDRREAFEQLPAAERTKWLWYMSFNELIHVAETDPSRAVQDAAKDRRNDIQPLRMYVKEKLNEVYQDYEQKYSDIKLMLYRKGCFEQIIEDVLALEAYKEGLYTASALRQYFDPKDYPDTEKPLEYVALKCGQLMPEFNKQFPEVQKVHLEYMDKFKEVFGVDAREVMKQHQQERIRDFESESQEQRETGVKYLLADELRIVSETDPSKAVREAAKEQLKQYSELEQDRKQERNKDVDR